jgi:hypothetical protein
MPFALRLATLCVLTVSGFLARDARADVVRTFTFSPHDVAVVQGPAGVVVAIQGGVPDGTPGGPELPAVPAFIELEPGQRVRSSTITATDWAPLGRAPGRLRTAAAVSPGLPRLGSDPDPAIYSSTEWFPKSVGNVGPTGAMRGRALASLALRPVRVRPGTGELEVATRIEVRLVTEADPNAELLSRRRIVPEWEEAFDFDAGRYGMGLTRPAHETFPGARIEPAAGLQAAGGGFKPSSVPSVEAARPVPHHHQCRDAAAAAAPGRLAHAHRRAHRRAARSSSSMRTIPTASTCQDRIRRFIKDAYLQWGTTHVLLGGDTDSSRRATAHDVLLGELHPDRPVLLGPRRQLERRRRLAVRRGFADSDDLGDNLNLISDVYVGRRADHQPGAGHDVRRQDAAVQPDTRRRLREPRDVRRRGALPAGLEPEPDDLARRRERRRSRRSAADADMQPRAHVRKLHGLRYGRAIQLTRAALLDS